jgi:spermidine synthase
VGLRHRLHRLSGPPSSASRQRAAVLATALSGFSALGYQIVWTRQASAWLGHETAAVLAVVAAFFAGLSVGALLLGPRVERSARPDRWYALLETVIALWSVALALALGPLGAWLTARVGAEPEPLVQWSLAFLGTFVALLPATAAMGATIPAAAKVLEPAAGSARSIATLYAANTFGAVAGVLATAFWLVPAMGLAATAAVCAGGSLLAATVAWQRLAPASDARPTVRVSREVDGGASGSGPGASALLGLLALTGWLGIGYEVLVVRVLSQVTEGTVFTFAVLLALYLLGTAVGAALARRRSASRGGEAEIGTLLALLALACLLGLASLWMAEPLRAAVASRLSAGTAGALLAEAVPAAAAFAAPTVAMGLLFSRLAARAADAGVGLGRALGVNTLGAALAAPLFGVALLPAVGSAAALSAVVAGYAALAVVFAPRAWTPWMALVGAAAVAVLGPSLARVDVPAGGRVVSLREGAMAAVAVVEDAQGVRRLHINNRVQEGSSATAYADGRQALLPLLLHPKPARALFLGLGTGATARAAAHDPSLQVDVAELLPEVVEASAQFRPADKPVDPGRPRVVVADARRFVRTASTSYDAIVSDNFHPARNGSSALYAVEHFAAVRGRLTADGVFVQWLPLHQLDLATLRSIVRSFLTVFPDGAALLATNSLQTPTVGLVGRADETRFAWIDLEARRRRAMEPLQLAAHGLDDPVAVAGAFVSGPGALHRFAGDAVATTDDRPVVAHLAPRLAYARKDDPAQRLLELVGLLNVARDELWDRSGIPVDVADAVVERVDRYRTARNAFLAAGSNARAMADPRAMLAQVGGPLLAVLETSPDLRSAREPIIRIAAALAVTNPDEASRLQRKLDQYPPGDPSLVSIMPAR